MVVIQNDDRLNSSDRVLRGPPFPLKQEISLGRHLLNCFDKYGDAIAQIYSPTGETATFTQLKSRSILVANHLRNSGIGLGDVISICSTNIPNSPLPLFGGLMVGAIIAPLDPSLSQMDIKHLMTIALPKLIFCEPQTEDLLEKVIQESDLNTEIVVFGETSRNIPFSQYLTKPSDFLEEEFQPVDFSNPHDHIAFLMSSSGTTGLPKCVALTHGNFMVQAQLYATLNLRGIPILNMSTLFWISGVAVCLGTVDGGAIRILTPPFDPERALQDIEKYKAFWVLVGVTYFSRMVMEAKAKPQYNLSSVRIISVNGGKASDFHLGMAQEVFQKCNVTSGYGMTELTGNSFQLNNAPPDSIGYLLPGLEAKICDIETGNMLGPDEKGELLLRGKIVFKGYYRNPKATEEAIDKDGWLHTGDLCSYDNDQCFYIHGRIKEQFKCRGWQISPLEMESVLAEHPEIKEAAVLGVPHKVDVARAKAFIVKRQNSQITEDDVHGFMQERMNKNKQITGGIHFVESLPVTPTGKIQRRALVELSKQFSYEE